MPHAKNITKASITKALACGLIAVLAWAVPAFAVTVGPLDDTAAPSLPPLGTPAGMAMEELPDTTFATDLEDMGDLRAAALEWQRIARKSFGEDRAAAISHAARLHIALGNNAVAQAMLTRLQTEYAAYPAIPQFLHQLATGSDLPTAALALAQLQSSYPQSPYTQAALLHNVAFQAQARHKVTNTFGLPQAEDLKSQLQLIRTTQQQKVALAGALGVLAPGLGHMYAGHTAQGVAVLIIWCLFSLAFLSACRHRHYAYAFIFVIPAAALWLTGPMVAMQLQKENTTRQLATAITAWQRNLPALPPAAGM